jgi:hypothetical protein
MQKFEKNQYWPHLASPKRGGIRAALYYTFFALNKEKMNFGEPPLPS